MMYALFAWPKHEPSGGVDDLVKSGFGTIAEARDYYNRHKDGKFKYLDCYQVVNLKTMTVVDGSGSHCL